MGLFCVVSGRCCGEGEHDEYGQSGLCALYMLLVLVIKILKTNPNERDDMFNPGLFESLTRSSIPPQTNPEC
jgi:hypothetical protein